MRDRNLTYGKIEGSRTLIYTLYKLELVNDVTKTSLEFTILSTNPHIFLLNDVIAAI